MKREKLKHDIHNYEKRVANAKRVLLKCKKVAETNKKLLLEYADFKRAQGISLGRIAKFLYTLKSVAVLLGKEFKTATKKDWIQVFAKIESDEEFSANTKRDYKIIARSFIAWLFDMNPKIGGYPDVIKWLRISEPKKQLPRSLVTEREVARMINVTDNPRNKALLAVLYDSGGRIGEILTLTIENIEIAQHCARLHVHGKTGERIITIIGAMPFLCSFLDQHPNRQQPEAPLFYHKDEPDKFMTYNAARIFIKRTAKKCKIKKNLTPYSFRHSKATETAKFLTPAQMNAYFGWTQGSKSHKTYIHLAGADLEKTLLIQAGLAKPEEEDKGLSVIKCPRCGTVNSKSQVLCTKCQSALSLKSALSLEDQMTRKDEEIAKLKTKFVELKTITTQMAWTLKELQNATAMREKAAGFMGIEL